MYFWNYFVSLLQSDNPMTINYPIKKGCPKASFFS